MLVQGLKPVFLVLFVVRRYWYLVIGRPPSCGVLHVSVIDWLPGIAESTGADGTSSVVALRLATAERAVPARIRSSTV